MPAGTSYGTTGNINRNYINLEIFINFVSLMKGLLEGAAESLEKSLVLVVGNTSLSDKVGSQPENFRKENTIIFLFFLR